MADANFISIDEVTYAPVIYFAPCDNGSGILTSRSEELPGGLSHSAAMTAAEVEAKRRGAEVVAFAARREGGHINVAPDQYKTTSRQKRAAWREQFLSERFINAVSWDEYTANAKHLVYYVKNGIEHKTPWLSRERARIAHELLSNKYGKAIVYVD